MHQNKRIIMWLHHEYGEGNDNVKTVIKALEKQIPKKPNVKNDFNGDEHSMCPNCYFNFGYTILCKDVIVHCWKCGQKIDWSVEE